MGLALRFRGCILSLVLLCTGVGLSATADAGTSVSTATINTASDIAESDTGFRSGSFILAPIPFSNPTIGDGLTLGAGYLFNLPGSQTSGIGAAKMRSSNGSNGEGVGGSLNFAQGIWTISFLAVDADLFYDLKFDTDFLGRDVSIDVPLAQTGTLAVVRVERKFLENFKFGIVLEQLDTSLRLDSPTLKKLPPALRPVADVKIGQISFDVALDTRDNSFYPESGSLARLKFAYSKEIDSAFNDRFRLSGREYVKHTASFVNYRRVFDHGVLALRGAICAASKDAPFFDSCGVGLANGLRGFPATEFIANYSTSLQAEYRGRFNDRFGYVVFGNVGAGGDSFRGLSLDNGGAAGGAGLRIRLSKRFNLDYAIDYARNEYGGDYFYIGVGQRF